jgi:hypothetical protein
MQSQPASSLLIPISLAAGGTLLALLGSSCSSTSGGGGATGGAPPPPPTVQSDKGWPQILVVEGTTNTIYQPQVQSWDGHQLGAIAAVSIQAAGADRPVFGTITLSALTLVDKPNRTVALENPTITKGNFPTATNQSAAYVAQLQSLLPTNVTAISLDRLEADLGVAQAQAKSAGQPLNNAPPRILVSYSPAVLVRVCGAPVFQPVAGTSLQRLINTHALILRSGSGALYLHLYDGWLQADSMEGPWVIAKAPPADLSVAQKEAVAAKSVDLLAGQADPKTGKKPSLSNTPLPAIHVETQASELLVLDGQPAWVAVPGTQLSYVSNTVANIFKSAADQRLYVLVSGRWFAGSSFDGPWTYTPANALPADFAKIPDESPKENVKASVAGTPQAQQAVIANGIPQSAKVNTNEVTMPQPVIFGAPSVQPIVGTSLSYVANSATPIIKVDEHSWYAVDKGLWFVSASLNGPWAVATSVPAIIYQIPPSSPMHYVTYVKIYNVVGPTLYAGYTPGYYGAVVNNDGVVVYGTGYDYAPWISGPYYVAPPLTYGYDATLAWTPWFGWGYGFAAGWAWSAGWGYWACCPPAPFWGPYYGFCYGAGYNAWGGVAAWGPYGWCATSGNIYSHWGNWSSVSRVATGYNAWTGNAWAGRYGHAYNSVTGTMAAGYRGTVDNVYTGRSYTGGRGVVYNPRTGESASVAGIHGANGGVVRVNNNVYAAADGHVFRPSSGGGWQTYTDSWNDTRSDDMRSFDDQFQARSWGEDRFQGWSDHSSSWGGFGGGFRGGGFGGFGGFRR